MKNVFSISFVILLALFISGAYIGNCASIGSVEADKADQVVPTPEQDGRYAEISISPKFNFKKYRKIAVFPLKEEGKTKQKRYGVGPRIEHRD